MFNLKNYKLWIVLSVFFIGCGEKLDIEPKKAENIHQFESDVVKTTAFDSSTTVTINRYYRTVGYFDEKNNLIRIERFLDGELL